MVYRCRVHNGRIELEPRAALPEGAEVEVVVVPERQPSDSSQPSIYEQLEPIIGTVDDLPEDLSVNHDHCLYGAPKRS
ncbi:MAG: hypothetical protein GXP27_18395 [Planctomycetes bacterium]|nr:hypothetical protein [Planctomycetota bacterium]